jgi:hypothetical protein
VRAATRLLLGALAGVLIGLVASEVIGVVGVVAFDRAVGIRYLPLILAPIFAAGAVLLDRRRDRSR